MYVYTRRIALHEADPAGVLFFGRYFALAHDAYENMLWEQGCSVADILAGETFVVPVVHAEADYKAPLRVGELATITLHLEQLRSRTFRLRSELHTEDGTTACVVRTTHCCVSTATKRPTAMPKPLRDALASLVEAGEAETD